MYKTLNEKKSASDEPTEVPICVKEEKAHQVIGTFEWIIYRFAVSVPSLLFHVIFSLFFCGCSKLMEWPFLLKWMSKEKFKSQFSSSIFSFRQHIDVVACRNFNRHKTAECIVFFTISMAMKVKRKPGE